MINLMTKGIHHITAIASHAQSTVHFYSKILGLRLVKKTVNQDDIATYHLFFGDRLGHPGMDLTFFIFQPSMKGQRGSGLVTKISFAVSDKSLSFWLDRFQKNHIKTEGITEQFGKRRILFFDNDDQQLELVGITADQSDWENVWSTKEISKQEAIQSFYSATLSVTSLSSIEPILTQVFGYQQRANHEHTYLYKLSDSQRANYIEVHEEPSAAFGISATGTVHHIAFRAANESEQQQMRNNVLALGLYPTEVIDRFYFKSVYFRTPAGILFEIATDGPGFTADEKPEQLGKKLALPPFLESYRSMIESQLPSVMVE